MATKVNVYEGKYGSYPSAKAMAERVSQNGLRTKTAHIRNDDLSLMNKLKENCTMTMGDLYTFLEECINIKYATQLTALGMPGFKFYDNVEQVVAAPEVVSAPQTPVAFADNSEQVKVYAAQIVKAVEAARAKGTNPTAEQIHQQITASIVPMDLKDAVLKATCPLYHEQIHKAPAVQPLDLGF